MMTWTRIKSYADRADTGYQISAAKGAAGWIFSAWAPGADPDASYWDWHARHAREHYPRGESIPQRAPWIGNYPSAEAARQACEAHQQQQQQPQEPAWPIQPA